MMMNKKDALCLRHRGIFKDGFLSFQQPAKEFGRTRQAKA